MTNYISAMELLTLLNKSKHTSHNLSLAEFRVVTYLLACANTKDGKGYKCWPSTETIAECAGINTSTVEKIRPKLVKDGWLQYVQGKGKGNSNTYYVNGFKIVECYMKSGHDRPSGTIAPTILEDKATAKKAAKGQGNLKQNKVDIPSSGPIKAPVELPSEPQKALPSVPTVQTDYEPGYPKYTSFGVYVESRAEEQAAIAKKQEYDDLSEAPF